MSGTEEMSKALKATTPGFCDMPSTIVRASIVQASTVYNDTPKTIGKSVLQAHHGSIKNYIKWFT